MLLQPAKIQPDVSGREIASCRTTAAGRPDLPYFSKSLSFVTCDDTSACNQIPPSPSLMTPRPGQGISVPMAEKPHLQLWAGMPISGGPAKESVSRKVISEGMMHTRQPRNRAVKLTPSHCSLLHVTISGSNAQSSGQRTASHAYWSVDVALAADCSGDSTCFPGWNKSKVIHIYV